MKKLDVFRGKNILVTGHTGFKGAWLSLWLYKLGANVTGISLNIPSFPSHFEIAKINTFVEDIRLDIKDFDSLSRCVENIQPDFVFHLAAQSLVKSSFIDPVNTWMTNTIGTVNLLESINKLDKNCVAIFVTSDKSYNNVEWPWGYRENDELGGSDPYSASKGGAEFAIKSYVNSFFNRTKHIKLAIGRAGNVIGGGDWASDRILPDCIKAWSINQPVKLRNPSATRPWQHVLEPISGYLNLASELHQDGKFHGEAFNFGPSINANFSVLDLVKEMENHWVKVKWIDESDSYTGPFESTLLKLNCDKALHFLKWSSVWDFKKTIEMTAYWYREYYENPNNFSHKVSLNQIDTYVQDAKKMNLLWAQ